MDSCTSFPSCSSKSESESSSLNRNDDKKRKGGDDSYYQEDPKKYFVNGECKKSPFMNDSIVLIFKVLSPNQVTKYLQHFFRSWR